MKALFSTLVSKEASKRAHFRTRTEAIRKQEGHLLECLCLGTRPSSPIPESESHKKSELFQENQTHLTKYNNSNCVKKGENEKQSNT